MTPQQQKVLAAFTQFTFPRTIDGITMDLGIPRPSVRRCISALITQGLPIAPTSNRGEYQYTRPSDAHGV